MIATIRRESAGYFAGCLKILGLSAALLTAACSSNSSPTGGTGGAGGAGGDLDAAVDTGPVNCAGMAISFDSNVPTAGDPAKSRVMVDFGAAPTDGSTDDLPLGNSPRTIEFWAFVLSSSWRGDANTMFEYGQTSPVNGGFGLDFGTVAGTIDPYTNGTFDNDNQPSGIPDYATNDQWIHFAMTYDQTAVTLYINGNYQMGSQGSSKMGTGMLATVRTMLTIGGNPRGAYFNGAIDEFRVWNIARSQSDIMATMGTTLVGNEAGLVGYWKFDDGTGTTAKDSVTTAGHTEHDGTLMATTAAMNPTWIPSTAPLLCP